VVLAAVSSVQLRYWQNTSTLFAHALEVTDRNYTAYAVMGMLLTEQGRPQEAMPFLEKALEYKPDQYESRLVYGNALMAQQKFTEAIAQYQHALRENPRMAEAYNGWAGALAQIGQYDQSLAKLAEALRLRPDFMDAQLNRALILQRAGRSDDAAAACRELMGLSVTNEMVFMKLGNGFLRERRFTDALGAFQFVLRLNPHSIEALNRVAWILSTNPDAAVRNGPQALRLATQANALTGGKNAPTLNTLAAAYAETGQFPAAIATAQQAMELASTSGPPELAAIIQQLLDLFKGGTPYRDQ
jgi:tetratricopeptide (TPR) repeat protein